jgi:hypothetical protein
LLFNYPINAHTCDLHHHGDWNIKPASAQHINHSDATVATVGSFRLRCWKLQAHEETESSRLRVASMILTETRKTTECDK